MNFDGEINTNVLNYGLNSRLWVWKTDVKFRKIG